MSFKTTIAATVSLSLLSFGAFAQDSPQEQRIAMMKASGGAFFTMLKMIRGESDYDADKVMESLAVVNTSMETFGDLFPEGSETGFETRAKAEIWSDREGFDQIIADLAASSAAAIAAAPQSVAELQPLFGAMGESCGGCHDDYRVPKE